MRKTEAARSQSRTARPVILSSSSQIPIARRPANAAVLRQAILEALSPIVQSQSLVASALVHLLRPLCDNFLLHPRVSSLGVSDESGDLLSVSFLHRFGMRDFLLRIIGYHGLRLSVMSCFVLFSLHLISLLHLLTPSLPNLQSIKPNDIFSSHCTHVHDMILASMLSSSVFYEGHCSCYLPLCFAPCFLPTHPWAPLPCHVFFIIALFASMEQLHVQIEIHISWTFHVPSPLLISILLCKVLVVDSVMHPCMTEEDRTGKVTSIALPMQYYIVGPN